MAETALTQIDAALPPAPEAFAEWWLKTTQENGLAGTEHADNEHIAMAASAWLAAVAWLSGWLLEHDYVVVQGMGSLQWSPENQ